MASDLELLDAWNGGDRAAGDELLARYFTPVCRFFRSKLGDDVDDLIQRTFLDCLAQRERFRGEGSFRSYLFAIARNRLYDHLRHKHRQPEQVDMSARSLADLGTSPSAYVARNEEQGLLLDALNRIPVDFRIALELAYWESMSGREIATALNIQENTVRSRLARARAALRETVQELAGSGQLVERALAELEHHPPDTTE